MLEFGRMLLTLFNKFVGHPIPLTLKRGYNNGHHEVLPSYCWVMLEILACGILQRED